MLKRSILDPQGRAVHATLERLGHHNIAGLRIGKRIEIALGGERDNVLAQLDDIARNVLSNPVMEDVEVVLDEGRPQDEEGSGSANPASTNGDVG